MIDVLCMSNGKITNLRRVTYVVIDEADRMFDLGFEPQIARILANIRPDKQTIMFSATFPRQIESLAKKILSNPVEIVVGQRGQSNPNVKQYVEVVDESKKLFRLLEILGEYTPLDIGILIFIDKQEEADELYKELYKLGYQSLMIHGGQDQEDRDFAIQDFKNCVRNILISTSVCARGLDVKHCGLVINFKCPNHREDYIHRVGKFKILILGRTGRAGNKGVAYTFISPDEGHLAEDILRVLEVSLQDIPEELKILVRTYKEKLESGEAEKFKKSGYITRGYRFDTNEKEKVKTERKQLKKGYGMNNESDDEELIDIKGKKNEDETDNSKALVLVKQKQEEDKKKNLFRDPIARQLAIKVGTDTATVI
jgi:ATP-dependent RNA helicase DDX46/PRP5